MKRFHFPLERVLRWRTLEFSVEEAKLKRLGQEQIRLQMQVAALSAERSRLAQTLGTLADPRGEDLCAMVAHGHGLRKQAEKLTGLKTRCERELVSQKRKYNAAKQRLRLLEQLRDRKLEEWRYQETLELETLAAESYLSNWNREHS